MANNSGGRYAKFGDSLPIEGLTEAANETAKVGANRTSRRCFELGISEDAFNEKAQSLQQRTRGHRLLQALSTEYQQAAEYNTLTASTQEARDATNRMEQAQAQLGEAIEPLTTGLKNMVLLLYGLRTDKLAYRD